MLKEIVGRAGGVGSGMNLPEWLLEQDPRAAADSGKIRKVMSQEATPRILILKNVPREKTVHGMEERICESYVS